jgi:uncharacterized protein YneR
MPVVRYGEPDVSHITKGFLSLSIKPTAPNRQTHENSKPDIIFFVEVAASDIWITWTLYAEAPEGACDFPNSENATPFNSQ